MYASYRNYDAALGAAIASTSEPGMIVVPLADLRAQLTRLGLDTSATSESLQRVLLHLGMSSAYRMGAADVTMPIAMWVGMNALPDGAVSASAPAPRSWLARNWGWLAGGAVALLVVGAVVSRQRYRVVRRNRRRTRRTRRVRRNGLDVVAWSMGNKDNARKFASIVAAKRWIEETHGAGSSRERWVKDIIGLADGTKKLRYYGGPGNAWTIEAQLAAVRRNARHAERVRDGKVALYTGPTIVKEVAKRFREIQGVRNVSAGTEKVYFHFAGSSDDLVRAAAKGSGIHHALAKSLTRGAWWPRLDEMKRNPTVKYGGGQKVWAKAARRAHQLMMETGRRVEWGWDPEQERWIISDQGIPGSVVNKLSWSPRAAGRKAVARNGRFSIPRVGTRVEFEPTPTSGALYSVKPRTGEYGTVITIPLPGGRSHYLKGPGGGLLYVEWDEGGVIGVSPIDVRKLSRGQQRPRGRFKAGGGRT